MLSPIRLLIKTTLIPPWTSGLKASVRASSPVSFDTRTVVATRRTSRALPSDVAVLGGPRRRPSDADTPLGLAADVELLDVTAPSDATLLLDATNLGGPPRRSSEVAQHRKGDGEGRVEVRARRPRCGPSTGR